MTADGGRAGLERAVRDLGIACLMMVIWVALWVVTSDYPQIALGYTRFVIGGLLLFTGLYIAQNLRTVALAYRETKHRQTVPFSDLSAGPEEGSGHTIPDRNGFLFLLGATLLYVALLSTIGFVVSTLIFLNITFWRFVGLRKAWVIASFGIVAGVWVLAALMLDIRLPGPF